MTTSIWSVDLPAEQFHRLVDGAASVCRECFMYVGDGVITCRALNLSNTAYGNITQQIDISDVYDPIAIDVGKLSSTVPGKGLVKIHHEEAVLNISVGKSRIRFFDFARSAVREPPAMLDKTLPNVINDVPGKELYDAVSSVIQYCGDTPGSFFKVKLTVGDTLTVSDVDDNISTDISCDIQCPSGHVTLSSLYMQPIMQYVKKYTDTVNIQMYTPESPLILTGICDTANYFFLIAPIIDVDK